jgi:sulfite exporter TauE/SafE
MLLYGRVVSLLGSKLKGRLYRISAVIVLVMGIIFVLRGYRG